MRNDGGGGDGGAGPVLSDAEREVLEGGRKAFASIQVTQTTGQPRRKN